MLDKEKQEVHLMKFIDKVKEEGDNALNKMKSADELKEIIANMCTNCLRPYNEYCDICNGHTNTVNELQHTLQFDTLNNEED